MEQIKPPIKEDKKEKKSKKGAKNQGAGLRNDEMMKMTIAKENLKKDIEHVKKSQSINHLQI
jgi:hypothetical protein